MNRESQKNIKELYENGQIQIGINRMMARQYCYTQSIGYTLIQLASHILLVLGIGFLVYMCLVDIPTNYLGCALAVILIPLAYMMFWTGCSLADHNQIIKSNYLLILTLIFPLYGINPLSGADGKIGFGLWLVLVSFFLLRFRYNLCEWVMRKAVINGKLSEAEIEKYFVVIRPAE